MKRICMFRQKSRKCSIQSGLFLLCILVLFSQTAIAISERLSGASIDSELAVSPISKSYIPPPGIMPIVVLQGEPYQMGYQYALQADEYIAIVRDAAWASALSKNNSTEIRQSCRAYREYITKEMPQFDFGSFFQGMTDGMKDQGYVFGPDDPLVMLYWGGRQGPEPPDHCTAIAAFGNTTNGSVIAGTNFDYYHLPSNAYSIILVLYPKVGHSCIIPSGAGRTGSNFAFNSKGLVYIMAAGSQKGPGDSGPGITGFLELPYVAMTCKFVPEAEGFLLNSTRMFGLNHLLLDAYGNVTVLEATRARYASRRSGDNNESNYLVVTNHYLNPKMKPSQPIWDPLKYYPSSYYRYLTAEKMIVDRQGEFNYSSAVQMFSSTDWWDGKQWHYDDPFSTNTINRFRPDVATYYSAIALPREGRVSICTGNPGTYRWGNLAPGQMGSYVNLTLAEGPDEMVFRLKKDASAEMWKALQVIGEEPPEMASNLWAAAMDSYWQSVWWMNRAILERNESAKATGWGRSASGFAEAILKAEAVLEICATS